jgi:Zn-dependent peptidase ImmA (M78 family)
MKKPDDCTLTPQQYARVRKEAERALKESDALGILPTPMDAIMEAANVEEVKEDVLNAGLLEKFRNRVGEIGGTLKKAISKVLGVFHAPSGLVFIEQTLFAVKKRFVGFHEAGHGFMPWQRQTYDHIEDCEQALDPFAAELFDREANVFASEVLFQLDSFRDMAEEHDFSVFTPVKLSKEYNASIYSTMRQYVSKNSRSCAVVVLNKPELVPGDGFRATLRRAIQSQKFTEEFGNYPWKGLYTPDDDIGALVPLGKRKSSGKRHITLLDQNGDQHECIAESFTQTYQVFILIHSVKTLTKTTVIFPAA